MIELYRSENLLVRSLPAQDLSRWVVTFDNYGIGHGFDRPGFGQAFLEASEISAIHVMGAREDWYQYPDIFEALATVKQALAGAEHVLTYGSSMGGYAALRFADAVGATAVLALSPQYSNDPAKVPFEGRWTQDGARIQWRPEIEKPLSMQAVPVVVYDPTIEDGQHLKLISADVPVHAIRLPYSGHPTTTVLAETNLLKGLVVWTLMGQLDVPDFQKWALTLRRNSANYISILAKAQMPQRPRLAMSLAKRAMEIAPHSPQSQTGLARIQSAQGLHEEAIALLQPMAETEGCDSVYLVELAEALSNAGRVDEAIEVGQRLLARMPDMAHLYSWFSHFYWTKGDDEEALRLIRKALSLDRHNPHYSLTQRAYQKRADEKRLRAQKRKSPLYRLLSGLGLVGQDGKARL